MSSDTLEQKGSPPPGSPEGQETQAEPESQRRGEQGVAKRAGCAMPARCRT